MPWRWSLAAGALLLIASACSASGTPPGASGAPSGGAAGAPAASAAGAPSAAPAAPVKLRGATTAISGMMAPTWAAIEGGLFAGEGLDVALTGFPSGNEGITSLIANEMDFLNIGAGSVVGAALGGAEVVVLTVPVRTIVVSLSVRPEIQQPSDLRGKAVGISRRGTSIDTAARMAMKQFGLEPDTDVAITQSGSMPNIVGALEANRIQAGVLSYPAVTQARKLGFRELLDIGGLGLPFAFSGISTRRDLVARQPDVALRLVRAQMGAVQRLKADRPFALDVFRKYLQTDDQDVLNDLYEVYIQQYMILLPYPDDATIQGVLDELAGEIPRAREVNPRDFYDASFVRQVDESGYLGRLGP